MCSSSFPESTSTLSDELLDTTTELSHIEQMNTNRPLESFYMARDNLWLNQKEYSDLKHQTPKGRIVALRFERTSHCLVMVFDTPSDCEEFLDVISLLKDFRNDHHV